MRHAQPIDRLSVLARHDLADSRLMGSGSAVLLEGSWPEQAPLDTHGSLDDEIDARFAWIDQEASRLAEQAAEPWLSADAASGGCLAVNPAWLNALGLRYYLVKLIRLVAYFTEVRPLTAWDRVQLVVARGRDEDYAHCMAELCRLGAVPCRVQWIDGQAAPSPSMSDMFVVTAFMRSWARRRCDFQASAPMNRGTTNAFQTRPPGFPNNSRWRRAAAGLALLVERRRGVSQSRRRVVLCGNPAWLDPVCRELVRRDCQAWWLYDRFAIRSWLRWAPCEVGQLVCESSKGRGNRLILPACEGLEFRGVNLGEPIARWLVDRLNTHGPGQTRILEQVDAHFRRLRPSAVVLDEDATPMARAVVAIARRCGTSSWVVQHGAPGCRFGFAPLAADRILAWGPASEGQLAEWGVPPERVQVVGSPRHETAGRPSGRSIRSRWVFRRAADRPSPRILLLATTPPRDDRPDAVTLHFTRRTYADMLRAAFRVVTTMPGAELIVKLHPRAPRDPTARAVASEFPSLRTRVIRGGPLDKCLARVDCVLSCFSSAGIDATLSGVPVIQLLPAGSGDVLPHDAWGMLGTARKEDELGRLLARALDPDQPTTGAEHVPNVFASLGLPAVARIADAVLAGASVNEANRVPLLRGSSALVPAKVSRFSRSHASACERREGSSPLGPTLGLGNER